MCESVRSAIGGDAAIDLAGQTSLPEWAALLATCGVVVANDSGGMHLAAAVGAPLVAVYGITDPVRTGPLGPRAVVLQKSDVRSRDVSRDDPRAREALERVTVGEVVDKAVGFLDGSGAGGHGP
jgi:ADP-heptose:LPS heptosyltransferase